MLMLVIVFFAVLEVFLGVYDYFNPRCDFMSSPVSQDLDYEIRKDICQTWKIHQIYIDPITGISQNEPNQHFQSININSHGFRGPEISKEKPDETYRIFVVGGSTTFSIRSLTDHHTIPGYLQQKFDESSLDKKIEVINAGISAITSTDELHLVTTKIIEFEPNLVIIYDGHNDVVNFPGKTKNDTSDDLLTQIWKKYLSFYNTPFVIGGIIADAKHSVAPYLINTNFPKNVEVWKTNLISICELGDQKGFKTLIFLQPFLGAGNKTFTEHEKELFEQPYSAEFVSGYELFSNELNDLENYCSKATDLRDIFDDEKNNIYFDRAHVASDSNKKIAEKIFEVVEPLVN